MKSLLEENIKLTKENNILLNKIWSAIKWQQISRALYWLIIIGFALGVFYYLKPMLGNFINLYTGGVSDISNIREMSKNLDIKEIQGLLGR